MICIQQMLPILSAQIIRFGHMYTFVSTTTIYHVKAPWSAPITLRSTTPGGCGPTDLLLLHGIF